MAADVKQVLSASLHMKRYLNARGQQRFSNNNEERKLMRHQITNSAFSSAFLKAQTFSLKKVLNQQRRFQMLKLGLVNKVLRYSQLNSKHTTICRSHSSQNIQSPTPKLFYHTSSINRLLCHQFRSIKDPSLQYFSLSTIAAHFIVTFYE